MLSYREKLAAFLLYDENQPRDDNGRWSSGGGAPSPLSPEAARIVADVVRGGNWTIQHDKGDEYRIEPAHMPERIVTFTNRRGDTEYYDPELAHVVDDEVFEGAKTVRAKEGNHLWLEDVPGASKEDGYLYRGMSYAEWEQVQQDGRIKSSGTHNVGDQQAGLTYYSVDPAQASSYASGFAAWQYKPTFDRPGIVVRVKDPGTNVDVRGTDTSERGIPHDIPTSDIVDVFEAHPYALRPGTVQFVQSPHGEYHEGSRDTPSPHVVWKRTTRKYSLRFDPDQPRDENGRWSAGASLPDGHSVSSSLTAAYSGQKNMTTEIVNADGKRVAYVDYVIYSERHNNVLDRKANKHAPKDQGTVWRDEITISMIHVDPEHRRKGFASELLKQVRFENPGMRINSGMLTPDGAEFWKRWTSRPDRFALSFNPDQPRDDRGRWTDGLGGVPTLSPADVLTGDVMVHGSPHAELSQLQPGSMFSNDPRWAAGYTTRSVGGGDDEQFVGAIHALKIPSGPTVYVRSVHDAERKLVEMAQSFGGRMPSNLKDAAEIVSRHSDLVAILAKRDGRITGGILVRPAGVTGRANPRETLNEAMDRGLPVPSNLERALKLNLSFDPAQPRDEIGRWTDGGGSPAVRQAADRLSKAEALANGHLSDAETRMRKIGASNIEEALKDSKYHAAYERYIDATRQAAMAKRELTVYTSADRVATQMGIDPRRVHVVQRDPREFEVGDMQFREGGRYNSETGLIEINARHIENELQADVIVAHELTHHVWSTIHRVSNSERNEIRALPPDEYNEMFTRGGFVRPDRVKDADERWPATRLLSRHTDAVTAATEEEYNSIDQRMAKLAEEDGVTTYSKAYWDAAAKVSNADNRRYPTFTAINETLAEMQAIRHGKVADLESRTAARSRVWNSFITDMLHTAKTHPKIKERLF